MGYRQLRDEGEVDGLFVESCWLMSPTLRVGLIVALVASLLQLFSGHHSAVGVAKNQPAKLAADVGHLFQREQHSCKPLDWRGHWKYRVGHSD